MTEKIKKRLIPLGIVLVAIVIATILYINRPEPQQADLQQQPLLVDAAKVVTQNIRIPVQAQGTVMPRTSTAIIAEVSGKIIEVSEHFKAGGFFAQDEVLLRIDDRDYLAAVKRAEAEVASAKSNQATEIGAAEVAYQDWKKYRSSVQRTEAGEALALRKPQLADAQAQVDSAVAELDFAEYQLERTVIRAPYDAIVREKYVDIGQYVTNNTMLAEIFAVDKAEVRLALPDNKLDYIDLPPLNITPENVDDLPVVTITTDSSNIHGREQQWPAHLVRTEGVVDERSRVLFAIAEIDDPYGVHQQRDAILRVGSFVHASIEGRLIRNVVALPRHILRAGNRIWVIDDQQRLQNREVQLLSTEGKTMYITAGLAEDELVCLSTISGAAAGTQVRIAEIVPTDAESLE